MRQLDHVGLGVDQHQPAAGQHLQRRQPARSGRGQQLGEVGPASHRGAGSGRAAQSEQQRSPGLGRRHAREHGLGIRLDRPGQPPPRLAVFAASAPQASLEVGQGEGVAGAPFPQRAQRGRQVGQPDLTVADLGRHPVDQSRLDPQAGGRGRTLDRAPQLVLVHRRHQHRVGGDHG